MASLFGLIILTISEDQLTISENQFHKQKASLSIYFFTKIERKHVKQYVSKEIYPKMYLHKILLHSQEHY